MDLEDFPPPVLVGNGDRDLSVEAAGPAQGGVQGVGQVGGRQHDDVLPLRQAVHQRQQLRHDAFLHVADHAFPPRRDGIDLIEEDDAGRPLRRLLEEPPQVGLALAVELVDDLRPVDGKEGGLGFVGHRPGQQRLAAARRAVQEHALRRIDPQPLEKLRVLQRQLDDLPHALQRAASTRRCPRRKAARPPPPGPRRAALSAASRASPSRTPLDACSRPRNRRGGCRRASPARGRRRSRANRPTGRRYTSDRGWKECRPAGPASALPPA